MAKYDENPEVILLDLWASPFAMRVRVGLALKEVDYEKREEEDVLYNKSTLLLQMNPVYKKVPVLIHKGRPICESLIILRYIDEVWSHSHPLLPPQPYARARACFLADLIDKKVHDNGWKIWRGKCRDEEEKKAVKEELFEALKLLEEELGEKPFFGGDELGFVDVVLSFFACWFYVYEKYGGIDMAEERPKIMGWVKRCMTRPSFYNNIPNPDKLYEVLVEFISRENLKAKKGGETE